MIYRISFLLSFLFLLSAVQAQELAHSSYKYKVAKQVFDQLIEAKGDRSMQIPTFVMKDRKKFVAWMSAKKLEIGLEEPAYDICASMGKDSLNAIAALLAHEIIHYYQKHHWAKEFSEAYFANLEVTADIKALEAQLETRKNYEVQADHLGGFLAYSAGYQSIDIMPQLLPRIYTLYALSDKIAGYPSKQDRILLSQKANKKARTMARIFDMANLFSLLGRHQDADKCFSFILRDYQSREIYNNAGVNILYSLIQSGAGKSSNFPHNKVPSYPLVMDGKTRLISNQAYKDPNPEAIKEAFKLAQQYLEQAINLDKSYAAGHLNLSCLFSMKDELEDAEYQASKAAKHAKGDESMTALVQVLNAIIQAQLWNQTKDESEKEEYWSESLKLLEKASKGLQESPNNIALVNKMILEGKSAEISPPSRGPEGGMPETLGDRYPKELLRENLDVEQTELIPGKKVIFGEMTKENYSIYIYLNEIDKRDFVLMMQTARNYYGQTNEGVKIGDDLQSVLDKYGPFPKRNMLTNGQMILYPNKNIIFSIDKKNKVSAWTLYVGND